MSRLSNTFWRAGAVFLAGLLAHAGFAQDRIIRAQNMTVARGQTNRLYISFESLGDENALGFTLCFDTNHLTFLSAVRGSALTNIAVANAENGLNPPSFSINSSRAASQGLVGIILGLDIFSDPPQTWDAGSNSIVEIRFRGTPGSGSITTSVSFCTNSPVAREVSSADGISLPVSFAEAAVFVQDNCSYSINTNAASFGASANSGSVNLSASLDCAWAVVNTNSWITITSATNGTGNATVSYSVTANAGSLTRSGTFIIAGKIFTVAQLGVPCTYSLNTNSASFGASADVGSVSLTTGLDCSWAVENTNSWIMITSASNGTGSVGVSYSVTANSSLAARSGVVTIGGQLFSVTQLGVICAYSLDTNAATFTAAGGAGSASLNTDAACPWTVVNTNTWITITSASSGSGSAAVNFSVAPNLSSAPRTGLLTIAGQNFTVTQQGVVCTYALNTNAASFSAVGGSGSVTLITVSDCAWTALNTNSWIAITSATNGTGSVAISYSVATNLNPVSRSGVLAIAGQSFIVTQQGVTCSYVLGPEERTHGYDAATNSISVAASNPCPWSVKNTNSWIAILSGSNGVGNGTVVYSVEANASSIDRTGTLLIGGEVFTVTQYGVCTYSVTPTQRTHGYGTTSGVFRVNAGSNCPWLVVNKNTWITITGAGSGTGNGTVGYTVDDNLLPIDRVGTLTIEGATLTITQLATACSFTLSPASRVLGSAAGSGTISVAINGDYRCPWSAMTTNGWITITANAQGTNDGSFGYSILANTNATARTGIVFVNGEVATLTQMGTSDSFTFQSIAMETSGQIALKIMASPAGVLELQCSSDLAVWTKLADVTNLTGEVNYVGPSGGTSNCFYRLKLP